MKGGGRAELGKVKRGGGAREEATALGHPSVICCIHVAMEFAGVVGSSGLCVI